MTLPELIAALERAEGPSRELDHRIWRLVRGGADHLLPAPYTSSLDAALTLVPDGSEWTRHRGANGRMTMQIDGPKHCGVQGQAATPALALCAAALKARA